MEVTKADDKKIEIKHEGVTIKLQIKGDLIEVTGNAMRILDKTKGIDVLTRGFQLEPVHPIEFEEVTIFVPTIK